MKFRVWDIKNNCYFDEICYIDNNGILYKDEHYNSPSNLDQEEYKIEYSSGLLDKSEMSELFEGDIIKCLITSKIGVIKYIAETASFRFFPKEKGIFRFRTTSDYIKLGNINENPKLLEK